MMNNRSLGVMGFPAYEISPNGEVFSYFKQTGMGEWNVRFDLPPTALKPTLDNEEDNHPLPFLSTLDLCRMRLGLYHPKWYPQSLDQLGVVATQSPNVSTPNKVKSAKATT